jgi:uncharacterized membrane protein
MVFLRMYGRRKLDRADKIQLFGMIGFFAVGLGFCITAFVRSLFFPLVVPDHIPFVSMEVLIGVACIFVGLVFGLIAVFRTLRRLYRERNRPRVPLF